MREKKYVSSTIPHRAAQLPYTNCALHQTGIACPKWFLQRGHATERAEAVLTWKRKRKTKQNPHFPLPLSPADWALHCRNQ